MSTWTAAGPLDRPAAPQRRCLCALPDHRPGPHGADGRHARDGRKPAQPDPSARSCGRSSAGAASPRCSTAERGTTMDNIRTLLDTQARKYGAQVIDVRIKRADLPDGTPLESAFAPDADRARAGSGDASARKGRRTRRSSAPKPRRRPPRSTPTPMARIRTFYDFYRAMQSYDTTFAADSEGEQPDHPVARQRISEAIPRKSVTEGRILNRRSARERESAALDRRAGTA